MAHKEERGLWVADDGSWGVGQLVVVDRSNWSDEQEDWLVQLSETDEVTLEDVVNIDKNIKPAGIED